MISKTWCIWKNTAKNPNDEEDEDIYLIQDNYKLKREDNLKIQ